MTARLTLVALAAAIAVTIAGVALAGPAPKSLSMRPAPAAPKPKPKAHGGFVDDMDCVACHTTAGWKLASTAGSSGFDHDRTGFPLRGKHAQSSCGQCHTGKGEAATQCEGCHKDPHEGRHDETCAECHTAIAWTDTNTLEQHRRTRMPLTGRHAVIDCNGCHTRQGGRTFSDVPVDCYACHRRAYHDSAIHPVHDGSSGEPKFARDCGRCHQTTAWSPAYTDPTVLPGMAMRTSMVRAGDHDAFFVLSSGSHRSASCDSCHADLRRTQLVRCDGCHRDATLRRQHGGVTQPRQGASCLRCHPRGGAR